QLEPFGDEFNDISTEGDPEQVLVGKVSAELFPFLGVAPVKGRRFLSEEQHGRHRVAILSAALWRRRFPDQSKLNGQTIKINGEKFDIVGVMPEGFDFPEHGTELWIPLSISPDQSNNTRDDHPFGVIGRLKPGVTIGQAQAEMDLIHGQLAQEFKETAKFHERVISLSEHFVGKELIRILLVLFGAVGFVLLIACTNTTNLMLARAVSRQKEMAIRAALGAARGRAIRQALTESLLIGMIGGLLGLFAAIWGIHALLRLEPDLPRFADVKIDGRVLIFTIALSLATSLLAGLAPAWQSTRIDLQKSLNDSSRSASGSRSSKRLRNAFVISEIALSLVLLIFAGLMISSLLRLERVDPGFRTRNILTMWIWLPERLYPPDRRTAIVDFFKRLDERVRAIPGVEMSGYTTNLPLANFVWMQYVNIVGHPLPRTLQETPMVDCRQISPGYFDTLGIRLLKGRGLNQRDTRDTQPVAVVNESFVRSFFPDEEPLGKRFYFGYPEELDTPHPPFTRWTIVGVVRDLKQQGLSSDAKPEIFHLHEQGLVKDAGPTEKMFIVIRSANDPTSLANAVRREVQALDKEVPLFDVNTMERLLDNSLLRKRLITSVLSIFSIIALLLAAAGIYSVISYSVTQRTREIGIRMALGAQRIDALKLIIGQGMRLAFIGIVIGLLVSIALTRFIESLLFEVKASDPLTYALIVLLIATVSTLACYLPARRAANIDPLVALKYE
ncbi:MAG: ABC transporter permease, partial [Blastocatellia bacterium]|nr:ABC transporter permease [Blastocatellia bacterium]